MKTKTAISSRDFDNFLEDGKEVNNINGWNRAGKVAYQIYFEGCQKGGTVLSKEVLGNLHLGITRFRPQDHKEESQSKVTNWKIVQGMAASVDLAHPSSLSPCMHMD
jgi:hypothetical protein